jgi:pyruvate carboxylase
MQMHNIKLFLGITFPMAKSAVLMAPSGPKTQRHRLQTLPHHAISMNEIRFVDTTLRDGHQSLWARV